MKKLFISLVVLLLALICCRAGGVEELDAAEAALAEAEASSDVRAIIRQLVICGNAWYDAGDTDKARDYCCRAFSLMQKSSDSSLNESCFNISNSLFTIARIYRKNNEPDEALTYLDRSLEFEKSLSRANVLSRRYEEKIEILIEEQRYAEALENIKEARTVVDAVKNAFHYKSKFYYLAGLCQEALGRMDEAEASVRKAVELAYDQYLNYNHVDFPVYLRKLAEYSTAKGDTATAISYYARALEIIEYHGNKAMNQEVCNGLAELYAERDPELSREYRLKAEEYDYLPGLENLASRIAIQSIDFPKREREQVIRNQRLKATTFGSIALLLLLILLMVLQRNHNLSLLSEARASQNESLRQSLQQKNQLLELASTIQDRQLSDHIQSIADQMGAEVNLTKREKEIAAMIAEGMLNKEIAYKLNLSVRTVENHRRSLYRKLGVGNSGELIKCLGQVFKNPFGSGT